MSIRTAEEYRAEARQIADLYERLAGGIEALGKRQAPGDGCKAVADRHMGIAKPPREVERRTPMALWLIEPVALVVVQAPTTAEARLAAALRFGRFEKEGWRVRKDGSRFWANVVVDAVHDEKGALVGFAKVMRDISERKERNAPSSNGTADRRACSCFVRSRQPESKRDARSNSGRT
jgi:hypothetical protein